MWSNSSRPAPFAATSVMQILVPFAHAALGRLVMGLPTGYEQTSQENP
jgi:hypothetical protein